jgi:hypothetical protein
MQKLSSEVRMLRRCARMRFLTMMVGAALVSLPCVALACLGPGLFPVFGADAIAGGMMPMDKPFAPAHVRQVSLPMPSMAEQEILARWMNTSRRGGSLGRPSRGHQGGSHPGKPPRVPHNGGSDDGDDSGSSAGSHNGGPGPHKSNVFPKLLDKVNKINVDISVALADVQNAAFDASAGFRGKANRDLDKAVDKELQALQKTVAAVALAIRGNPALSPPLIAAAGQMAQISLQLGLDAKLARTIRNPQALSTFINQTMAPLATQALQQVVPSLHADISPFQ